MKTFQKTKDDAFQGKLLFFTGFSRVVLLVSLMTIALTDSPLLARIFYTGAIAFMGVNIMGTIKAAQLVCVCE